MPRTPRYDNLFMDNASTHKGSDMEAVKDARHPSNTLAAYTQRFVAEALKRKAEKASK